MRFQSKWEQHSNAAIARGAEDQWTLFDLCCQGLDIQFLMENEDEWYRKMETMVEENFSLLSIEIDPDEFSRYISAKKIKEIEEKAKI